MMYRDHFQTTIGQGDIWFDHAPFIRLVVTDQNGIRSFRLTYSQARDLAARLEVAAQALIDRCGVREVQQAERANESWRPRTPGRAP